jgi:hypothetical protein
VRLRVILWIESLPTTGDPLNHEKNTKPRAGIQDKPSLSKVVLAGAAVCPPSCVERPARRTSQVHGAREVVCDGIATAENRDSYADI